MPTIGFLHTADVHVETFRRLVAELAPGWAVRHVVDESLLADARVAGVTPEIAGRTRKRLAELESEGAEVIVCTCSTIGAAAEETTGSAPAEAATNSASAVATTNSASAEATTNSAGAVATTNSAGAEATTNTAAAVDPANNAGAAHAAIRSAAIQGTNRGARVPVLRVDRPMADAAVAMGERIAVVAAVESTLEPTMALLRESASQASTPITLVPAPCPDSWGYFESGEYDRYYQAIADHVRTVADQVDVVVLAQASMMPAVRLLTGLPVLTSPESAVRKAITIARDGAATA